MPAREFDSRASEPDPDPIRFVLTDVAGGREFRCVRMIPPAVVTMLDSLPPLVSESESSQATHVAAYMLAIRSCLVDEDRDAWDEMTMAEPIADECYAEVMAWLMQVYSDRLKATAPPGADEAPPVDLSALPPLFAEQARMNTDRHGDAGFDVPDQMSQELETIIAAGGGYSP